MPQKILLFDGFSILNRAYYALPLFTNTQGEYTNAIYGFINIFNRFCEEEKPDYITVAFDLPKPTFRHLRYPEYKATRKSMPDELRQQVPVLKNLLKKMNIDVSECEGFEADDVIGTLASKADKQGLNPVIISGDRDLLQLATDTVRIRLPKTKAGKTEVESYYASDVQNKYGVSPLAFIHLKALMGDTSDNVPGVPSIGEVTATKIIKTYGTIENAIENAHEVKPKKAAENLVTYQDQARLSYELVTIDVNAPVELNLTPPDNIWNKAVFDELKRMEIKSFHKYFKNIDLDSPFDAMADENKITANHIKNNETSTLLTSVPPDSIQGYQPTQQHVSTNDYQTTLPSSYPIIDTPEEAEMFFACISCTSAFHILWDQQNNKAIGIGIALQPDAESLPTAQYLHINQYLSETQLMDVARPWLESDTPKMALDIKNELTHLRSHGITPRNITFDTKLAAYIINSLQPMKTAADIALQYLDIVVPTLEELLDNKGKRTSARKSASDLLPETAASYAAGIATIVCRCHKPMQKAMIGLMGLYNDIELPLATVLADMEAVGIQVNPQELTAFGKVLDKRVAELTQAIYDCAGYEFNIQSPMQLGELLFEKLGLKGGKKTTKGYSTAADELEKLKNSHPIVPLVMEYRAHSKLKSTYVDGLLPLINPVTSRIHSTFHQALTATGRISSAEPNLQNIPVRMPLGRRLRKAFVPRKGCVFVDADYSQIELRVLAHMSGDSNLINAFNNNEDIHRLTASQVLGIPLEEITPEQRNNAKAVNFGIIYGISAFGLSQDIGVSVKEAESYITGYFEKYTKVKAYLDETIENAINNGYVSTLYNRRRAMPELKSPNFAQKAFGKRVAMNMPIQGTAADIIKIAMINVANRLKKENLTTKLILQVHDELLLEVPHHEVTKVKTLLKQEMENAATLRVPLLADVNEGESWYDTK